MVSLCRILQSDDFSLSAEEAYWLGLVDEVQGSGLPNLRELLENVPVDPDQPKVTPASEEPPTEGQADTQTVTTA